MLPGTICNIVFYARKKHIVFYVRKKHYGTKEVEKIG
jgi:hypothetical protein